MLHSFLTLHRAELLERCNAKSALRFAPGSGPPSGVPFILDQLIASLQTAYVPAEGQSPHIAGHSDPGRTPPPPATGSAGETPSRHGLELLKKGFPVEEVVHGYGDLCQLISDLAMERHATIQTHEFRTLNACLDQAIADALVSYSSQQVIAPAPNAGDDYERLSFLVHELRNHLQTATLALSAMKAGSVGLAGATAAVLDRSLAGLQRLIDHSLDDVRTTPHRAAPRQTVSLADFIAEIQLLASFEANARQCTFVVEPVAASVAICVDRGLLLSAVGNLLQNAFKFTRLQTRVVLTAFAAGDRALIEVADSCGGLPPGDAEELFRPYMQKGHDKSGIGVGLAICRRNVEADGGTITVRDVPGSGCVFAISLPLVCHPRPAV